MNIPSAPDMTEKSSFKLRKNSLISTIARVFVCLVLSISLHANTDPKVKELRNFVLQPHPGVYGWCSQEKAAIFFDLILQIKPDLCVEVGVFGGTSFFPVASALKFLHHGIAVAIDPWSSSECIKYFDPVQDKANRDWWTNVEIERYYDVFLNVLSHYQLEERSVVMRTTSEKAASVIGTIDFLHLDGTHTEIMTTKEVQLYLPKVRSGGYICLNDTLWPAMQPAVELLLEVCEVVQLIDNGNTLLFRKK